MGWIFNFHTFKLYIYITLKYYYLFALKGNHKAYVLQVTTAGYCRLFFHRYLAQACNKLRFPGDQAWNLQVRHSRYHAGTEGRHRETPRCGNAAGSMQSDSLSGRRWTGTLRRARLASSSGLPTLSAWRPFYRRDQLFHKHPRWLPGKHTGEHNGNPSSSVQLHRGATKVHTQPHTHTGAHVFDTHRGLWLHTTKWGPQDHFFPPKTTQTDDILF